MNEEFHYREKKGATNLSEKTEPWIDLPGVAQTAAGKFSTVLKIWRAWQNL